MDATDFTRAAYEPSHRPALLAALRGDRILRDLARKRVEGLAFAQERGQMLDRDHISKSTYEVLTRMLAQIDAVAGEPPEVTVE